jgi:membrane protein required for colicin V production
MEFTYFDYFVLTIIIFFAVLGALRGFMKELFSIIDWVISSFLTVLITPPINTIVSQKISNPFVAKAISGFLVFIILIIGISIVTMKITNIVSSQISKSIDINLGIAFGIIKGFLISSLIFISILSIFGDIDDLSVKTGPEWIQKSSTYRPLSFGGYVLSPFVNSIIGNAKENMTLKGDKIEKDTQEKIINEIVEKIEKTDKDVEKNNENNITNENDGGYRKDQREKLDYLIDIVN